MAPGLPMSRRALFCRIGGGFGALGLGSVLADAGLLSGSGGGAASRGRRGGIGPVQSAGAAAAAFPRAGEAGDLPVHERRAVARRHLRPQAGAGEVRRPGPAGLDHDGPPQGRQDDALAVRRAAARRERHRGVRPLPARRRLHRRHLRAPLAVHGQPESRAVAADDELGQHAADPAEPGLVADLRPGHREPEPARLRGALPGQAGRRPAVVEQQLPARHLPGHAHPQQRHRPGPDHPRRHQPPPAPRGAARAGGPDPVAQPRAHGRARPRRGARGPRGLAGDGLPHAVRGARGVRPRARDSGDPSALRQAASSPAPA